MGKWFFQMCQAVVGVLYPVKSREHKIAQVAIIVSLLSEIVFLFAAIVWPCREFYPRFICALIGMALFYLASFMGHRIEVSQKEDSPPNDV